MRRLVSPHRAAGSTSETLAYWKCDDGLASLVDTTGSYTLASGGGAAAAPSLFAVPAGSTGAAAMDGAGSFTSAADAAALTAARGEWTITAVVRLASVTGTRGLVWIGLDEVMGGDDVPLAVVGFSGAEMHATWAAEGGGTTSLTSTTIGLEIGRTYLVAWTKSAAAAANQVNVTMAAWDLDAGTGETQSFSGQTGPVVAGTTGPIMFVGGGYGTTALVGTIADVRFEKAPLVDTAVREIASDYAADYDELDLYRTGRYRVSARVLIEDADGVMRDTTSLGHGRDFLISAAWGREKDQTISDCAMSFAREHFLWSLARDMEASSLNLNGAGQYKPLVDLSRKVRVETAILPEGMEPREIDFRVRFKGSVDDIDWSRNPIEVRAMDPMGELMRTQIRAQAPEISNISRLGSGVIEVTTADAHGFGAGQRVSIAGIGTDEGAAAYEGAYTVASAGLATLTFRTEQTIGGTPAAETSGRVFGPDVKSYGSDPGVSVETVIQEIIDDNEPPTGWRFGPHELYVPEVSGLQISPPYSQQIEPVATALDVLVTPTGWALGYEWDDSRRDFRLTLRDPGRDKTTSDLTIGSAEVLDFQGAYISLEDVRNVVRVRFSDQDAAVEASGDKPRRVIERRDPVSILQHGTMAAELSEASTSLIRNAADAGRLADAFLADLSQPRLMVDALHMYRPHAELDDLYQYNSNGMLWNTHKKLAVVGYMHTLSDGQVRTSLSLSGRVVGRFQGWIALITLPGLGQNAPLGSLPKPVVSRTCVPEGILLTWTPLQPSSLRSEGHRTEIHVSTTSGFVPSASTLRATTAPGAGEYLVAGLIPLTTYYCRIVTLDTGRGRSPYSDQVSCAPVAIVTPTLLDAAIVDFITLDDIPAPWVPYNFAAYKTTEQLDQKADFTIIYNTETADVGASYDHTTGIWTCQNAGIYDFTVRQPVRGGENAWVQIEVNTSGTWVFAEEDDAVGTKAARVTLRRQLAVGNQVRVRLDYVSGAGVDVLGDTNPSYAYFSGVQMGQS